LPEEKRYKEEAFFRFIISKGCKIAEPWHNEYMKRLFALLCSTLLLSLALACQCRAETGAVAPADQTGKSSNRVMLHPSPPMQPETLPVVQPPPGNLQTSAPNPQEYIQYEAYNTFPRDLDLWGLEAKHLIRSQPVLSPDKTAFVYTEVMFIPNTRQTYSRLYWVPIQQPPPPPPPHLPSEEATAPPPPPPVDPSFYANRIDPAHTMKLRQSLVGVGYNKVKPFDFKTLTIVDWSASGQRLLFKERNGVLHVGLRTSDILIYDQAKGVVTVYPEIHRIIKHFWTTKGNLPHIETISWDIQPLGWEPGSDSVILLKAWAYDQKEKKFLGLWQYDVDAERTQLLQLQDDAVPVAANGWLANPLPVPRQNHRPGKSH
jgi:hypothetical protein